ncbi:enoyl-CoA hydratase/carnithine racemase [Herbaspirillum rubrisubalbicans]|uniref:crotonase/enoyl-CoA hydratase family protein n=1 Tax=Herbaspirillum rubrisubalbicans TaxID=80842 RepID=UPI00209D6185|nr:crotonase/enoyl-CoA hydratase family protein [Herbaspirillum rubrisubalbicans]MCP1572938.1 enoyl-CoA hydratase/carnithine racemase [Herbaspirillum rubrisubalbicans]
MENRHPDGQVKVERHGSLLLIGIDRPEKRNGFTPKMFEELARAYTLLETTPELTCGLLYAEGEHFTAGLDMPKIAPLRQAGLPLFPAAEVDPFALREPLRKKPVVIALKGICFTVAVELMLASEVAIAADDCRFAQLEVKRGIMAGCGATIRMVERAGWGNAMKILLTGDEFSAQEALRLNFVQEVVPAGQEFARALEVAQSITRQAPLAVQATMANARLSLGQGWLAAYSKIQATQAMLYNTDDAKEGVQSFLQKRAARFVGR